MATPIVEGSSTAIWLHRPIFEVTFEIQNTGKVAGSEVRLSVLRIRFGSDFRLFGRTDTPAVPAHALFVGRTSVCLERLHRYCTEAEREEECNIDFVPV